MKGYIEVAERNICPKDGSGKVNVRRIEGCKEERENAKLPVKPPRQEG